jgi:hypothetical protein
MVTSTPQDEVARYSEILEKSKTAYAPNVKPTQHDLDTEINLRKATRSADRLRSDELKESYYGKEDEDEDEEDSVEDAPKERGALDRILHTLGTPLYGVVGGVEAVLGKGSKRGLANIRANIEERGTFGDLIRSYGVDNRIAMPLGFALDIALDPVNWLSGGGALIPRLGIGAVRGGSAGLKAAAVSGTLGKVARFGEFVGSQGTKAGAKLGKTADGSRNVFGRVSDSIGEKLMPLREKLNFESIKKVSDKSFDDYYRLTGGVESAIEKGNVINNLVEKTGLRKRWSDFRETDSGKTFVKVMEYSPTRHMQKDMHDRRMLNQNVFDVGDSDNAIANFISGGASKADSLKNPAPLTMAEDMSEAAYLANNPRVQQARDILYRLYGEDANLRATREVINSRVETILSALTSGKRDEIGKFLKLAEDEKGIARYMRMFSTFHSEVDAYDKAVAKLLLNSKFRDTLATYTKIAGLFKIAKVPGNPVSYTNAVVGNVAMVSMAGIDVMDLGYAGAMKTAISIMRGKDYRKTQEIFNKPEWSELLSTDGSTFRSIFGVDPRLLKDGDEFISVIDSKLTEVARLHGKSAMSLDDEIAAMRNALGKGYEAVAEKLIRDDLIKDKVKLMEIEGLLKKSKSVTSGKTPSGKGASVVGGVPTFSEQAAIRNALRSAVTQGLPGGGGTTFLAQEIMQGEFGHFVQSISKAAASEKNPVKKKMLEVFDSYLTKLPDAYSSIDQTGKLAVAIHLAENGVSHKEAGLLATRFNLKMGSDIVRTGGNFKFTPRAAMEVANDILMNYQAMPGFVKIMRNLPIFGKSFISFSYGMTTQIGKAAIHNPGFFNKVQFLLSEVSGRQSPLEKKSLDSEYYRWMDNPGMVKIPWFKENPIYLNMENMLPHYSVNLLQDPQRSYRKRYGDEIANAIDKSPFFKEPAGQILLDWVILPMALGEAQGVFGQPLWPKDAEAHEKVGRAVSASVESVVPGLVGFGALLPGTVPDSLLPYVPSYRYKQLENAMQGRTSIGATGAEPKSARSLRVISGMLGLPVYSINLNYAAKDKK